ncbi:hypothetical protein BC938DRAFT_482908 [Jimgerdemannia flammicorona]|uniref:Uncharacterized protein n=1 Tax=Jimgerdemannia flammicorona TaxID=994334 RepID=A0A433R0P7_9FUNG|nr:hypothetical protein BC938DRAFT_482908 [Jimgerdemannia flammicorona]
MDPQTSANPSSEEAFRIILADAPRLIRKAIELEWTVVRFFVLGTIVATALTAAYLMFVLRNSKAPLKVWESLGGPAIKLFRPWLFAVLLTNANPFSGSIRMLTIFCFSFSSIHAGALVTFAETIGGLAAISTLNIKDRAILISLKIDVCLHTL